LRKLLLGGDTVDYVHTSTYLWQSPVVQDVTGLPPSNVLHDRRLWAPVAALYRMTVVSPSISGCVHVRVSTFWHRIDL